ncbi:MAG TPA: alpha-N-arabinofuranosidase [Steroidobacteraceae bacterium]|nr:alpha-N-arabinofuranosidase [Steroidobacteraceae bacterium]
MFSPSRRRFLRNASLASLAAPAGLHGRLALGATSAARTQIYVDSRRTVADLDRRLFGSFLEHLGRAVYDGVYDPGSPLANSQGFRTDILDLVRKIGVPIIRYPGGNFVSGYNWLDGIGPMKDRPRVLDKAWNALDTNRFGTDEFMSWCKAAGTEPLMAVNLGNGTPEQAAALVEYCNVAGGTKWSDLRRANGHADPYKVRHWCLGNEMDGPWQIGHSTAQAYGYKAADAARQMRAVDPTVYLTASGSSNTDLPTYLQWDREVLEQCYELVDGLSIHQYFGNDPQQTGGSSAKYLALNLAMDRQISDTIDVCDYVRARKRSPKTLWISFDEWNVWYRKHDFDGRHQVAPHQLEEVYNLEDALLVGGLLNTLMRRADRVKIACLAQLVNVIAPIMTDEKGYYLQTIYHPYRWALEFARGAVLDLLVNAPTYSVPDMRPVPYIDAAGTVSPQTGETSLFLLNRDLEAAREVEIVWEGQPPGEVRSALVLTGDDLKAVNSFQSPHRVQPDSLPKPGTRKRRTTLQLPPRSYSVIQWHT